MGKKIRKAVRTEKPWGYELLWWSTNKFISKILVIKKNQRLSRQYHKIKDEVITLGKGRVFLVLKEEKIEMLPGYSYHIKHGMVHRLIAVEDSEVIEISTPEKNDTVRLYDDYGRVCEYKKDA